MSAWQTTQSLSTQNSNSTFPVGITQPTGIAPLDLLTRYPTQVSLLKRFSSQTIYLDQYITPTWIPLAILGSSICVITFVTLQWGEKQSKHLATAQNAINRTRFFYLSVLSVIHIARSIVVVLIDLDTAWDTGLLAWNQLSCPIMHALDATTKLALPVITLTLGIEVLTVISKTPFWLQPLRWVVAVSQRRKAIHIVSGLLVGCGLLGLIETAYWSVQYYLQPNLLDSSDGLLDSLTPMARCEVAGQYQHLFSPIMHKLNTFGNLDSSGRPDKSTKLAASYTDYKWIGVLLCDTPLYLGNILVALSIIRVKMFDRFAIERRLGNSGFKSAYHTIALDVKYIAILLVVQSVFRLPEALFLMLEPLTRPGDVQLTDSELEMDGTWQRYFLMLSARVIAKEFADMPAAFIFPICLLTSRQFRSGFCRLFAIWRRQREPNLEHRPSKYGDDDRREPSAVPSNSVQISPGSESKRYVSLGNLNNTLYPEVNYKPSMCEHTRRDSKANSAPMFCHKHCSCQNLQDYTIPRCNSKQQMVANEYEPHFQLPRQYQPSSNGGQQFVGHTYENRKAFSVNDMSRTNCFHHIQGLDRSVYNEMTAYV